MENLTIKGNEINKSTLEDVKAVFAAPVGHKTVLLALMAYAAMIVSVFYSGQWAWIPVITLLMLFYLFGRPAWKRNRLVEQMVKGMSRVYGKPSCTFDVTFEAENVKSINAVTRETVRMPYADFVRFQQAKNTIALVTQQGQMVVLDRRRMDEATEKQALAMIGEKCVNLPKKVAA